jgi:hypothetical protein
MLNNTEVIENNIIYLYTNKKASPLWIFKMVYEVVTETLADLRADRAYKLKSIFIKADKKNQWKRYAYWIRRYAGYCMSHLAETGQVDMEFFDKGSNSKRYRPKVSR